MSKHKRSPQNIAFVSHNARFIAIPKCRMLSREFRPLDSIYRWFRGNVNTIPINNLEFNDERCDLMNFFIDICLQGKHETDVLSRTLRIFLQSLNIDQAVENVPEGEATFLIDEGLLQRGHSLYRLTGDMNDCRNYYRNISLPDLIVYCTCDPAFVKSRLMKREPSLQNNLPSLEQRIEMSNTAISIGLDIFRERQAEVLHIDTNAPIEESIASLEFRLAT